MAEGLSSRMLMEHKDAQGHGVFTSRAWRRLFEIKGPLVHELILEFFSTFRFGEAVLDLDMAGALEISSARDFLGTAPSYTSIREPMLRLCHRQITCSIAGSSQAPKKERLQGLMVIVQELPVIDMAELWIRRLEEELYELWRSIMGLRGDVDRSITDQGRFTTWMVSCMTQLMDASGHTQAFNNTLVGSSQFPYERRTRRRTDDACTSTPHQLDP
ncbi:hypothetical protein Tco_1458611 [Tanacetum coccineum]